MGLFSRPAKAGSHRKSSRRSYQGRHHLKPAKNEIGSHRVSVQDLLGVRGRLVGWPSRRKPAGLWVNDSWAGGLTTIKPQRFPTGTYGRPTFGGLFRDFT